MEVDDIISYHDVVAEEKIALQKGMNYGVGKNYSVFLMSLREGAPYADALDPITGMLTYEGHDDPQRHGGPNPKEVDQRQKDAERKAVHLIGNEVVFDCCKACALAGRIGNARIPAESVKKVNEITTRLGNDIIKKE